MLLPALLGFAPSTQAATLRLRDCVEPPAMAQHFAVQENLWSSSTLDSMPTEIRQRVLVNRRTVLGLEGQCVFALGLSGTRRMVVYLVRGSDFVTLGGAAHPQSALADDWLRESTPRVSERCELLAKLLDTNGGEGVLVLDDTTRTPASLQRAWEAHRPADWPHDGTVALPEQGTLVRVSVASFRVFGFVQGWTPATTACVYSPAGHLINVERREGRLFGL
jgi:hypothetical protein